MQITVFAMLALLLLVKIMLEKQEKNFKVHIKKLLSLMANTQSLITRQKWFTEVTQLIYEVILECVLGVMKTIPPQRYV